MWVFLRKKTRRGQSLIEWTTVMIFVLTAFLIFQKYIVRGFAGRWKSVGDALGGGHIYDPRRTLECAFDPIYTDQWYNVACYEAGCIDACFSTSGNAEDCTACITGCIPSSGSEPNCSD
jgi:hypothetical protein